ATKPAVASFAQSLLRSFLHNERNQGAVSHGCESNHLTLKGEDRFTDPSSDRQANDFGSEVTASRVFKMAQEMINPRPGQEALEDSPSSRPVLEFRHPTILLANLLGVSPIGWFARSQDGEVGVDQHLGVGVCTGVMRLRFEDQGSNQAALRYGQPVAQPLGVVGTAF